MSSAARRSILAHTPVDGVGASLTVLRLAVTLQVHSAGLIGGTTSRTAGLLARWRLLLLLYGVTLIDEACQSRDHRYLVFEHRTPNDEASVVVTCALINRMKTDLTEEQFKAMVAELAKVFTGGTFDECAFPEGMTTG